MVYTMAIGIRFEGYGVFCPVYRDSFIVRFRFCSFALLRFLLPCICQLLNDNDNTLHPGPTIDNIDTPPSAPDGPRRLVVGVLCRHDGVRWCRWCGG